MTSWKRGEKNEDKGERMMKSPEMGEKVKGAAYKAAGEIEQGLDNVRDRVTGKQHDLQGKMRHGGTHKRTSETSHAEHEGKREASHAKHETSHARHASEK